MSINTIIFDLDGTLLYTLEDLNDSVNFALEKHNYPLRSLDEVRGFVGNGVALLIERALPSCVSENTKAECLRTFKEHYSKNMFNKSRPYDGVVEVLEQLKRNGYNLAVVSNKHDEAVKNLVNTYFSSLFDVVVGQSDSVLPKPSIDGVDMVLKTLSVDASECVFVGDSEVDIQTANNAGMSCMSVVWGYKDIEFLYKNGASVLLYYPEEILELL